jgi:hypothetical protein
MYNITIRASGVNADHMAGYFPLVMGKAPLLWLDNLPAECITSWVTLSRRPCLASSRPTTRRPTIALVTLTTSQEYG